MRSICALLLIGAMAATGGCYRRVVDAEGVGSKSIDTHDANLPDDDPLDTTPNDPTDPADPPSDATP